MPSDSMNIGVSGMDAYQAQIDVISNNIANVGTVAYKGQNLTFQDLLYQTQQPASAPTKTNGGVDNQQVGIGVKVGATDTDTSQGGVQTTGVNTNMMINGDGYFILNNSDGTGAAKYTRNGDFSLNQDGLLYDPTSGLGVMGFTADSTGNVTSSGAPGPIQIPIGLKTQATGTGYGTKLGPTGDTVYDVQYGGSLDSRQYAAAVSNGGVTPAMQAPVGITIYDSLGAPHLVTATFSPQLSNGGVALPFAVTNASGAAVTAATEWSYTLSSSDPGMNFQNGATTNSPTSATQYAFFDQAGQFINTSSVAAPAAAGSVLGGANVHQAGALPSAAAGDQVTITKWASPGGANNGTTQTPTPGPIGLDLSGISSTALDSQVNPLHQNGFAPGTLSNISVGQDGTITGAFTNGQSQTLARVALATFQNEQGLTRIGSSQYTASANSGAPQIGTGNSGRFGAVVGDSLELSNVSIADQFTKLITAQNAFTANSKSITTANQDDQTVIGLIR